MADQSAILLVVAVALTDRDGRVLVQRRPAGKAHGGLWEFPGGKVEPGESPEAALARELAEELAITVEPTALAPLAFASAPAGARHLVLLLYRCEHWQGVPRALEADALAWCKPRELLSLEMPPADIPLAAALLRDAVQSDPR